MTEEGYLRDGYARAFRATVERVVDGQVVLDRTHFYPEGGGQPPDHGFIHGPDGSLTVTDVQKRDTIYHSVKGNPPEQGTVILGELDWGRRYAHMRHHTAQHLLSAVLLDAFDAETTGNQLYADRARIDCAYERFSESDLGDLEALVNEHVEARRRVHWYQLDRDVAEQRLDPDRTRLSLLPESITEVRIVEIEHVDRTACAGTHVRNTEAAGPINITGRETKGSEEERIHFELE